jgi:hypothetical protein
MGSNHVLQFGSNHGSYMLVTNTDTGLSEFP